MIGSDILRGIIGITVVLSIAFIFSTNRRAINWRLIGIGLTLQLVFAMFVLKISFGRWVFEVLSHVFVKILKFTEQGAQFVFGPLAESPGGEQSLGFFFAFQILPTIIFFASLMGILYHLNVMQRVVQTMAWVMAKTMGTSGAESLSVAANVFIGQTEAPLVIRPYIAGMTRSELLALQTGGMATIAGGVLAAYVKMLGISFATAKGWDITQAEQLFAGHLLAASVMAAPAALIMAKMIIPETEVSQTKGTVRVNVEKTASNVIDAAAVGASDGMKLALNVAAMLLAFIALIAMFNSFLGWGGGLFGLENLTLELILGIILSPVTFAVGVPWNEAVQVGSLVGTKVILNEFVAYYQLAEIIPQGILSEKSIVISTFALCGFANFASIAIQIGGIGPLAENRRSELARNGLRAVLGGSLATLQTAAIAGALMNFPQLF
jgi:concentrative nucleoside transporter, CNT family